MINPNADLVTMVGKILQVKGETEKETIRINMLIYQVMWKNDQNIKPR